MNPSSSYSRMETTSKFQWGFWIINIALLAGFILSILSWLEICVEHCSANQDYRLFSFPFSYIGMTFFSTLLVLHFFSRHSVFLTQLTGWLIASALGAEGVFIAVQKYQIGHWCPVCLSIALSVGIAGSVFFIRYMKTLYTAFQQSKRGSVMNQIKQGLMSVSFIFLGAIMAFFGVAKANTAEAAINDIKSRLAFGSKNSPVEVYFVTDWFCPACKKVEPEVEKILPSIESKATLYFIDYPIHKKSLNFTPYNLAFLINNKSDYLEARYGLAQLTQQTEAPTDEDVMAMAEKYQIPFKELTFLDVKTGMEYFESIIDKYNLNSTPTVIITNPKKNKVIKLEGRDEISNEKILKAIKSVS
ncbi:thioredoxin domain-containing protein [Candidatus Protochlamydia phocaeensis]|uniref:thioredoxin domain-containing protein n=1 Tax=Candidatus Protochlamydia phocaeensis TaxID=1414722 RepID=UPI0009AE358E|nr:thioredoxin domain-containing protein [Candidatus Protochlamydia phocaeensis]